MKKETKEWIEKKAGKLDDLIDHRFITALDRDGREETLNHFLTCFVQELVFKIILSGVNKDKIKKGKKKSYLLYPITVLEAERDNSGHLSGGLIAQLNKAIQILNDERYKLTKEEFKKEVEKKKKEK